MSDGKGTQTYEYDETTGNVKELKDTEGTSTLTFTAAYDIEGNMTSETYPNAMNANYTRNTTGQSTGIEYVKTAHCAKTCPETWYSDVVVPSIHGQWITQQSTQAAQTYTYDEAGRLTQVLDNQASKGCTTRIYAYEEEGNRTSLTTRPPGTGGACATEGGEEQTHTYDPANRLLDTGTEYDSFGNTTKLPAADAGGTALTSTYYQNNELASQTQGSQTIGDQLDPAGRTREIVSTGKIVATEIQHYSSPEARTPSWTGELSGNYTRYITGIGGGLLAIRHNNEKASLQLPNLHGDIIATAHDEETATTLESTITEASEYGVPATETPPKYSWLGSHEIPTTLPSGTMAMGARSYIPQLGRYLQTDPRPGGSENQYAYVYGDPVNTTDLTGEWTFQAAAWVNEANAGFGAREEQAQLAREQTAREEAERNAARAAAQAQTEAAILAEIAGNEEGPEEEWWEEEEEEYADYHQGTGHEAHVEDVQLVQSLGGEESGGESATTMRSLTVRCKAGVQEPCGVDHSDGEASIEPSPEVRCGGSVGGENVLNTGSRLGRREYANAHQCPAQKSYPRGRRWVVKSIGAHATRGRGEVRFEHDEVGCFVGALGGATFAAFSSAGLATSAGAYAGCAIGAGVVELFGL